jgi:flagellar protein FliT
MNHVEQNALIEQLLALTLAIEHAATLADWPDAARLIEERSPLFKMLTREQDASAMATLRRIQAIDAAIATDAQSSRNELEIEYSAAMSKVQAVGKYQQAARL